MRDPAILKRFAKLCGGRGARIAIIPTASQLRETGEKYVRVFEELGVRHATTLSFEERRDTHDPAALEVLEQADGVFLTGGNQLRLSTHIGGTPVADLLRRRNLEEGLHVAGTSAGASYLSEHMIAHGDDGPTPLCDMVTLAPGLGLSEQLIIDQHFRQRDRLGRLLTALAYNPNHLGVGLDEDTAAFIGPDDALEVVGSGAITVVDPSDLEFSSIDQAQRGEPVCIIGVRLHVLVHGATFSIRNREARPGRVAHQS